MSNELAFEWKHLHVTTTRTFFLRDWELEDTYFRPMSLIIHSPESRTTVHWASGTSTQMFIYPSEGNFADRNFLFRVSSATVEAEESTFTFFEGITRHLMILKGELELIHDGRYTKHLNPYDQDTFSGEWDTRSIGKVTDFNLMLKGGTNGYLRHHTATPGNAITFLIDDSDYYFVYVASGSFTLSDGSEAKAGDLIEATEHSSMQLDGEGDLIEIRVTLNRDEQLK
jgi:environmental stress-induced protein Ves